MIAFTVQAKEVRLEAEGECHEFRETDKGKLYNRCIRLPYLRLFRKIKRFNIKNLE